MIVLANGMMKSGTHALLKALELNHVAAEHGHFPYRRMVPAQEALRMPQHDKHLFIVRNPRNVVISLLRQQKRDVTEATILAAIRDFDGAGYTLSQHWAGYARWLANPAVHVVAYERLLGREDALRLICEFVGVPYVHGSWAALPLAWTKTRNAIPSNWRQHWTPAIETVWQSEAKGVEVGWQEAMDRG